MNNIKKRLQISNSTNNFSLTNMTNLMSKTFYSKGIKSPNNKINSINKIDIVKDDKNINKNQEKGIQIKYKRALSSQNFFINNRSNKSNNNNLINKNEKVNYKYCASIYSAPSVKENRLEIDRILKINRNKRLSDINNIHNSIMVKESKIYRKKLQFLNKDNNSFDEKIKLKSRYNMSDMNELNNIKINLHQTFQEYYLRRINKRNFWNKDITLKNSRNFNKGLNANSISFKYVNDNTTSTKKTNYFTPYFSSKNKIKSINELNKKNKFDLKSGFKFLSSSVSNKNSESKLNNKTESIFKNNNFINNSQTILLDKENNNESENKNENPLHIYKDIEVSKMSLDLNDILFNQNQKIYLSELGKKLLKYKSLQAFQENRLELMSKKDINGLIQRIILLEKSLKKYNQLSIEYFREINNYIRFLKDKFYILKNYYEENNIKRLNLYFEVEKLVTDNILKQQDLEYLVEIRLFLIQVKYYIIKRPNYFSQALKETSRKYELGKLILRLKNYPQNSNVARFLESIPEIKNMTTSTSSTASPILKSKAFLKQKSIRKIRKNSPLKIIDIEKNKDKEKVKEKDKDKEIKNLIKSPRKKVFESPEELMILFNSIESKNLRLIKENDYLKTNINIVQKEYDDLYRSNLVLQKYNDLDKKEEILKKLKEEYIILNDKFNNLKNNKFNEEENNSTRKIKEGERGIYLDLNIFKKFTYYKILSKYKYKGLLVLEKLIGFIQEFFALNYLNYGISRGYKLIGKNSLNKLLEINRKNINNLDKHVINDYILMLLKLYENICEYIKFKDMEYNSIKENKNIIHKKREEIQIEKKIKYAKAIKDLAEEKRINGIKNIAKRNNKHTLLYRINVDDNVVLKNKIKKNKKLKELGKKSNNLNEKEFNFYLSHDS